MTAKAVASAAGKPLLAINHLEGHALTARLTDGLEFPYLLLLVSGGHTQIVLVRGVGDYQRWATTIDDALGEAFDKTAKMLGLPYPGGPNVERVARDGNAMRFTFPRPMKGSAQPDFSFAGLKTAVRQAATAAAPLSDKDVADICASFQAAVSDALADRVGRSLARFRTEYSRHRLAGSGRGRRRCREQADSLSARSTMRKRGASASSRRRMNSAPTMPR